MGRELKEWNDGLAICLNLAHICHTLKLQKKYEFIYLEIHFHGRYELNITLSPEIEQLVQKKIEEGAYKNVDAFFEHAARQTLLGNPPHAESGHSSVSYDDVEDLLVGQPALDYYTRDADDSVTLDSVRNILSKIPGSLSDEIIEGRR